MIERSMVMIRKNDLNFWAIGLFLIISISVHGMPQIAAAALFAKGADVSWLPQMEAKGYKFYNDQGIQQDCMQILKDHGINAIRLRTWVNPSNDPYSGHCRKDETVALAKRAVNMGFRIMLDFHYSDSWADPGKQVKPKA
jgi:arabinogalactan endo-1,4-beta-galactosidase